MIFEYKEYFTNLFVIPMVLFFLGVLFSLISIHMIIKVFKLTINKKSSIYFVLLVFSVALIISGFNDLNFNIIRDDESFYEIDGDIISIENVSSPPRFHYNNDIVSSSIIEIDGDEYYIMYIGDFEVGDKVVIEYLPKSHIVLSIHYSTEVD